MVYRNLTTCPRPPSRPSFLMLKTLAKNRPRCTRLASGDLLTRFKREYSGKIKFSTAKLGIGINKVILQFFSKFFVGFYVQNLPQTSQNIPPHLPKPPPQPPKTSPKTSLIAPRINKEKTKISLCTPRCFPG